MAIQIPIISEFDGGGIDKAKKEFAQLEGAGAKASYAIKKAAVPAGLALAGLAAGALDAAKAAIEDQQASQKLAFTLERMTGASKDVIAATEDWIATQGRLLGVSDDELRPALATLVRQTMDVGEAQKAAELAMDISAGTGRNLSSVVKVLEKAYGGNLNALAKLDPSLRGIGDSGIDTAGAMQLLSDVFGGSAANAANTAAGQMQRFNLAMSETKESIGTALLPVMERLLPYLDKFAKWAQDNPNKILVIAGAIGVLSAAIVATNIAMAANPVGLITAGIIALGIAVVAAYKKFEGFRNVVRTVVNGVLSYVEMVANGWISLINIVIRTLNLLKPGKDIPLLSKLDLGRLGEETTSTGGPNVRMMAEGGIVTGPTLAIVGEAGPEAVIPLDRMRDFQGGGNVTINVHGGDPNAVVDALRRYMRQNGSVPIRTSTVY